MNYFTKIIYFLTFLLIFDVSCCNAWTENSALLTNAQKIDETLSENISSIKIQGKSKCTFIKTMLFDKAIIIYDVCLVTKPFNENFLKSSFTEKTLKAFALINKNPIGKQMLKDLTDAINKGIENKIIVPNSFGKPLVIFPNDFLDKIQKFENVHDVIPDILRKRLPNEIHDHVPSAPKSTNWVDTFNTTAEDSPCFTPVGMRPDLFSEFLCNTVILNLPNNEVADFSTVLINSYPSYQGNPTITNLIEHIKTIKKPCESIDKLLFIEKINQDKTTIEYENKTLIIIKGNGNYRGEIVKLFKEICEIDIGKMLIEDIVNELKQNDEQLIIFPTQQGQLNKIDVSDFNISKESNDDNVGHVNKFFRTTEYNNTNFHEGLSKLKGKDVAYKRYLLGLRSDFNSYRNKEDGFNSHTIAIGQYKSCLPGFLLNDLYKSKEITIKKQFYELDKYALFHELNHCRHFLQQKHTFKKHQTNDGTYKFTAIKDYTNVELAKVFGEYRNSLNIPGMDMDINEEELQMTGHTKIDNNPPIKDPVNEIYFRIQSDAKFIRYPYSYKTLPFITGFEKIFYIDQPHKTNVEDFAEFNLQTDLTLTNNDDIILFHELNHARHFIKDVGTYKNADRSKYSNSALNNSSLGITVISDFDHKEIMESSEEELQLTGYTALEQGQVKTDSINETYYRMCDGKRIRFPYNLIVPEGKKSVVNGTDLKLLLDMALKKKYSHD